MANSVKSMSKRSVWTITLAGIGALIAVVIAWVFMNPGTNVTNFTECKAASGRVMETYPEQCSFNGKNYTNESQSLPKENKPEGDEKAYIGLGEQAALNKARSENVPARVVERDGEPLPADMSFVEGRLNFYIEDGVVVDVVVEKSGQ